MKGPSAVAFAAKVAMVAGSAVVAAVLTSGGCGPGGDYRVGPGAGSGGGGGFGVAGAPGTGGGTDGGTGGMLGEPGGAAGTNTGGDAAGGRSASGGRTGSGGAAGGSSTGGRGGGTGGGAGMGGGAIAGTGGAIGGSGGVVGSGGGGGGGGPGSGGTTGSGGIAGAGGNVGGRGGTVGSGGAGGMGGGSTGSGGSNRRILSVDFVGAQVTSFGGAGGKTVTPMPMALTEIAGLKPAANWNSAAGPASPGGSGLTPLLLDTGSTAGNAAITWNAPTTATSPGIYSAGLVDEAGDARMMNGYLDPAGGSPPAATITVTGLPAPFATSGYDVYVYFLAALGDGQTRKHQLTLTTSNYNMSVTVSQTGPTQVQFSGYTLATATTGNYVVFKNVTGSQLNLTSTAVSTTTMALRAPVNGFQIVWPSGS